MAADSEGKKELDQRIFDWCVDSGHKLIDRGYASAWFNWLGWVALSSALLVVAKAADSALLYAVFILSIFMLFFVGLAGVEKFMQAVVGESGLISRFKVILAVALSVLGLVIIFEALGAVHSFTGS